MYEEVVVSVSAAWEAVKSEQLWGYSAGFGFRYSNMVWFVRRRRENILFDSHCLSTCVCYERRDRLFLPTQSKQSDSLNSLLEALLDTHHGHLHTRTHTFRERKVCYENMLMIWLWLSLSPCVCTTPRVLFDITTGCVSVCYPTESWKENSSLSVVCFIWFFLPDHPKFSKFF